MKTGGAVVLPIQVTQALEQGSKIEAIKLLRESSGMGLKESKEAIETYLDANPLVNERLREAAKEKGGNFASLILFLVAVFFAYGFFESSVFSSLENLFTQPKNNTVVSAPMPDLFYPQTIEKAIALYEQYSLEQAAAEDEISYDTLARDPLKVKYLLTKQAVGDYAKYLSYDANKAFSVSGSGAYGYSGSDRVTLEVAAEEALTYCEKYNQSKEKCYVVDINGIFLGRFKN